MKTQQRCWCQRHKTKAVDELPSVPSVMDFTERTFAVEKRPVSLPTAPSPSFHPARFNSCTSTLFLHHSAFCLLHFLSSCCNAAIFYRILCLHTFIYSARCPSAIFKVEWLTFMAPTKGTHLFSAYPTLSVSV